MLSTRTGERTPSLRPDDLTQELAGAVGDEKGQLRALTVGRQKTRLRGSRHTNPRYPTRPKDIHLENPTVNSSANGVL